MPKGHPGVLISHQESVKRWRENNPQSYQRCDERANAKRRGKKRFVDPIKLAEWRRKRFAVPGYRERINQESNKRAHKIRRWLDAYKVRQGCIDCGYREHHAALHFDHVRGEKEINVANAKSIAQAQTEIEKCEVRCANCHAVKTFRFYPCKPEIFKATYEQVPG